MDENLRIEQGPDDGIVLHLSNYAAWALLRRITRMGITADAAENAFVDESADAIEEALR